LKTAVWGGLGIGAVWLFGAVLLGGWRTAEHIVNHSKPKATIPEKLFVWVLIFAFFFLISEIKDKFSNTRWFIGLFRRKYNS
jgi:hypothetical protein